MLKAILYLLLALPVCSFAQLGLSIGLKGGLNFANITSASQIKAGNRTGYMVGGYISSKPKKIFGFRSEIILSRQGYDYKTNTNSGNVDLDYLLLPQLIIINFAQYVQLHLGGQAAILLNAKVDSTGSPGGSLLNYFNRFDYGFAAGAEVFPLKKGLFIGGRFNVSFNGVSAGSMSQPNFIPGVNAKNNVVQIYAGWRF